MLKRFLFQSLCVSCCLFISPAFSQADEWAGPQEINLYSPNGLYHARIIPGKAYEDTFDFQGTDTALYATAVISKPGTSDEKTFNLLNPVSPVDAILLDDGSFIAFDNWHSMGYGPVAVRYDREGNVLWRHELEGMFSEDLVTLVPRSVSSRWWRRHPFEWALEKGKKTITVTLWNEDRLRFRISDGRVEYAAVKDVGDDPQRLLNRAQWLATRAHMKQEPPEPAITAYHRVISLNPHLIEAYQGLVRVYEVQKNYESAIATLKRGIEANPVTEVKSSEGRWQSDSKLWLHLQLARVYRKAGNLKEAEAALEACLKLDPGFWDAALDLAYLWFKTGRDKEADGILSKFFELKKGKETDWNYRYHLSQASLAIGDIYKNRNDYQKAKEYYLKSYDKNRKPDYSDQFLYQHLAETHEALDEYSEALEVLGAFKSFLEKTEGGEHQLQRVEEAISRLQTKIPK
ncbi:MAG: tetratricopeptide repeat protein [Candidatus Omnitrophota bacterium]